MATSLRAKDGVPAAEATAACRVTLAGEILGRLARGDRPADARSIVVALDRRPLARAQALGRGVQVESKDTLLKVEVDRVADLAVQGVPGLVRRVLQKLGVESGVRVEAQARVPFEAGLGSGGALAVAVAAAAARVLGKRLAPEALAAFAGCGEDSEPEGGASGLAAVWGGVVMAPFAGQSALPSAGDRLRVDPSRIEECLTLVDPASGSSASSSPTNEASAPPGAGPLASSEIAALVFRMKEALEARRYGDVAGLIAAEHEVARALLSPESAEVIGRIASLAAACGGAARACGPAPRSLALVWAEPGARAAGPKERVQEALKAKGYRSFPCRVDLRGLEVEGP
jgi:shikimate kinase